LDHENRRAGGLRRDSGNRRDEATQDGIVVGIALRRDLDPEPAVSGHPRLLQLRWKRFDAHSLGGEEMSRLAQRSPYRRDQSALGFVQGGRRRVHEGLQRPCQAARLHRGWAVWVTDYVI